MKRDQSLEFVSGVFFFFCLHFLSFLFLIFLFVVALYSEGPFSDRHCKYAAPINAVVCGVDLYFFLFLFK